MQKGLFAGSILVKLVESLCRLTRHPVIHVRVDLVDLRIAVTGKSHGIELGNTSDHLKSVASGLFDQLRMDPDGAEPSHHRADRDW